ncbi:MAG: hypothetical protein HY759_03830 [Nitrospirae bacterium]|nr:hypothetical protein [Nitrospirota bacterium]
MSSHHFKEADGTSGQDTNSGSGVKTGHIQNGAVTPSKIGFYRRVVVVAPSGGDFTSPVDAVNSITDASATNPYLVKIMPGVYDLGGNGIQMKSYVDIEGSGENITKIIGGIGGADNAEVRFLTFQSDSGGMSNFSVSPKITNYHGVVNAGGNGSPKLTNVSITTAGNYSVGVFSGATPLTMDNVKIISENFAVYTPFFGTTVTIQKSSVKGVNAIANNGSTVNVALTKVDGYITGGLQGCYNIYDANFAPITCP